MAQWIGAREAQEDAAHIAKLDDDQSYLLVVCDGMGGHVGGELASNLCVNAFARHLSTRPTDIPAAMLNGVNAANDAVRAAIQQRDSLKGMGSTLVAAYVSNCNLYWASVGDSHLYVIRGTALFKINEDHSMWPLLMKSVEKGDMTIGEAKADNRRHQLRSAIVGETEIPLIDISTTPYNLKSGDTLILATDGIDVLSDDELVKSVAVGGGDAEDITKALINKIKKNDNPSQDNVSVVSFVNGQTAQAGIGLASIRYRFLKLFFG